MPTNSFSPRKGVGILAHMDIRYFSRPENSMLRERVYGDRWVKRLYQTPVGRWLSPILASPLLSRLFGLCQDHPRSARKVPAFVKKFAIDLDLYEPGPLPGEAAHSYQNFNQFFIRRFKPGVRPWLKDPQRMAAPCEARYFGWSRITDDIRLPVKGSFLRASELVQREPYWSTFAEGPLLIARLCPVDYHRFHFPDDGVLKEHFRIPGTLHSVNPMALQAFPQVFIENERHVNILETEHFGTLAMIEVGAICVGKIQQSFQQKEFQRGEEKGFFLFGGSTVLLLGQAGAWRPSDDILKHTAQGLETYLHLGTEVAIKDTP